MEAERRSAGGRLRGKKTPRETRRAASGERGNEGSRVEGRGRAGAGGGVPRGHGARIYLDLVQNDQRAAHGGHRAVLCGEGEVRGGQKSLEPRGRAVCSGRACAQNPDERSRRGRAPSRGSWRSFVALAACSCTLAKSSVRLMSAHRVSTLTRLFDCRSRDAASRSSTPSTVDTRVKA